MKKIFSLLLMCTMVTSLMAWDALYIVGGGTKQAGWDNERIPMVRISETEFEYSGYFYKTNGADGENQGWKIIEKPNNTNWNEREQKWEDDWGCTQYHPAGGWAKCARGAEVTINDDNTDDRKFWVDESGFYTINIKTDINKLTISNSDKPKRLFPVGGGCEVGWNNHSNICLTETYEGSGIYKGQLTLVNTNDNHEMKFLTQPVYTAHVGPKVDEGGMHDISGAGTYDGKLYTSDDHKFGVLDQAAGTFNVTYDWNNNKLYFLQMRDITVKAHINAAALEILGAPKCCAWWNYGVGESEIKNMIYDADTKTYNATFSVPTTATIQTLVYSGQWLSEGGQQTVDVTNNGAGFSEDVLLRVVETKTNDGKLNCYAVDAINSNKITVNLYAEDAEWADAYFFSQHVAENTGYNGVFVHPTKGADNWYTYTYEGVDAIDWVARPNSDNWDNQVNDVAGLSSEKWLYVMADKHANGHHKMADMGSKTLPKTLSFEFKFDGAAATSWGNESPVGLYYWQYYSEDCAAAADHATCIEMSKGENDVYTATVKALNNVKFVVQSDLSEYHGTGHYTVGDYAQEESIGFAESEKFWIRDNGSGHYVELTENFDFTPAKMHITLNKDGFASFYWDKNYELSGADAYVAKVSGENVVLTRINGNGIIPARSAVVLYGAAGATVDATETLNAATGYDYENALRGATTATTPDGNYYVLAEYEGETGFVKINNHEVPANRAYLPEPTAGAPARLRVRFAPEVVTGIDNVNDNANVNKYIRNGRVYIVRDNKVYTVTGQCVNL